MTDTVTNGGPVVDEGITLAKINEMVQAIERRFGHGPNFHVASVRKEDFDNQFVKLMRENGIVIVEDPNMMKGRALLAGHYHMGVLDLTSGDFTYSKTSPASFHAFTPEAAKLRTRLFAVPPEPKQSKAVAPPPRRSRARRKADKRLANVAESDRSAHNVLEGYPSAYLELIERVADLETIARGRISVIDVVDRQRYTFHHSFVQQSVYQKLLMIMRDERTFIVRIRIRTAGGSVVAAEVV